MDEMGSFPLGGPILALEGTSGPSLSLPSRPMNKVTIIAEMEIFCMGLAIWTSTYQG